MELTADIRMVDIVAERFDIGIRLGDGIAKDMIAVRVGPDMQMAVVASPDYVERHGMPQTPHELHQYQMLSLRLPTYGGLLTWEFLHPEDGTLVKIQSQGRFASNSVPILKKAALGGLGLQWIPLHHVEAELQQGSLVEVLPNWRMRYPGFHLYYPNRRANDALFTAFVAAMKET